MLSVGDILATGFTAFAKSGETSPNPTGRPGFGQERPSKNKSRDRGVGKCCGHDRGSFSLNINRLARMRQGGANLVLRIQKTWKRSMVGATPQGRDLVVVAEKRYEQFSPTVLKDESEVAVAATFEELASQLSDTEPAVHMRLAKTITNFCRRRMTVGSMTSSLLKQLSQILRAHRLELLGPPQRPIPPFGGFLQSRHLFRHDAIFALGIIRGFDLHLAQRDDIGAADNADVLAPGRGCKPLPRFFLAAEYRMGQSFLTVGSLETFRARPSDNGVSPMLWIVPACSRS